MRPYYETRSHPRYYRYSEKASSEALSRRMRKVDTTVKFKLENVCD